MESGHDNRKSEEVGGGVFGCEENDGRSSVDGHQTVPLPPPLLPSATSSPEVGGCHVTSPVAAAAIWAVLPPGRPGGDFASSTPDAAGGRFPCAADYVVDEMASQQLVPPQPYVRDVVYPASYPAVDPGDQQQRPWSTYYPRGGGGLIGADLPPPLDDDAAADWARWWAGRAAAASRWCAPPSWWYGADGTAG